MTDVKILEPVLLTELAKQGIAAENLELWRDYAPCSRGQGYSPYARCYSEKASGKNFSVISALPMVDAYGQSHELAWQGKNGTLENGNNIFHAIVGKSTIRLLVLSDQLPVASSGGKPIGLKKDDEAAFYPQLFIDGVEILPLSDAPRLLDEDPINENYHYNVLEWDYGVCRRRIRIIEGRFLGSWVFVTNPKGDVLIKYNQSGKFHLRLQYAKDEDTEFIAKAYFDEAVAWPVTISDSLTFYPDANVETTSVDGYCTQGTAGSNVTWASLVAGAGTTADDSGALIHVFIQSGTNTDYWKYLRRMITVFPTSGLPDDANISAATVSLYAYSQADNLNITPNINIYSSAPASNTALAAGDFDSLGSTAFCDTPMTYAGWSPPGYKDFTLNASGITAISKTDVTKFGFRNVQYDVGNTPPAWVSNISSYLYACSADYGTGYHPNLVVTYTTGVIEKSAAENGAGTDAIISGNPIILTSSMETGSGLESLDSRDLASSETGSGLESLDSRDLASSETGSGLESLDNREVGNVETGVGLDIAFLLTTLAADEIGSGSEAALKIVAFLSGDTGLGVELSWMLKDAVSGDVGGGHDALQSLINTIGSGSDMRLYERPGLERKPSKQIRTPSKGVNI